MQPTRLRRTVLYLHHTRDADGDVVFYFVDPTRCGDGEFLQSSPVVRLRRLSGPVLERDQVQAGRGKYLIVTQNTDYEVQLSHERAAHLAREVGSPCPLGRETLLEAPAKRRSETEVNPQLPPGGPPRR